MKRQKAVIWLLPLLLACPAIWASFRSQSSTSNQQQDKQPTITLGVDLVVVNALVMQQPSGRIVGDLKKDDFSLFEDGIKQQISQFSKDKLPLSVILIVDRAGCLDPSPTKCTPQRFTLYPD